MLLNCAKHTKTQCVSAPYAPRGHTKGVFFRAHPQRKIVDKNGFFSLVGRHSQSAVSQTLGPFLTAMYMHRSHVEFYMTQRPFLTAFLCVCERPKERLACSHVAQISTVFVCVYVSGKIYACLLKRNLNIVC